MADAGKNAQTTNSGDAVATTFAIGFPYTAKADVIVKLSSVQQSRPGVWDFDVAGTSVVFVTPPPTGTDNIVFTRQTDHPDPVVTFSDSAPIPAADLDRVARQVMHYTEEVEDQI